MKTAIMGILTVGGAMSLAGSWLMVAFVVIVLSEWFGDFAAENLWIYWTYAIATPIAAYGIVIIVACRTLLSGTKRLRGNNNLSDGQQIKDIVFSLIGTVIYTIVAAIVATAVLAAPSSFVSNAGCEKGYNYSALIVGAMPLFGIMQLAGMPPWTCEEAYQ